MINKNIINVDGDDIEIYNMRSCVIPMDDFLDDNGKVVYPDGLMIIEGFIMEDDEYYAVSYEFDVATGEWAGEAMTAYPVDFLDVIKGA